MKTINYIEMLKSDKKLKSNYAVAKYMGLSTSTLTNYTKGKTCFSDDVAIRFASELGLNVGVVLADIHAERETDPVIHKAWVQIARSLQQATAAAFFFVMVGISTPSAEASTLNASNFSDLPVYTLCELKKILKKCVKWLGFSFFAQTFARFSLA